MHKAHGHIFGQQKQGKEEAETCFGFLTHIWVDEGGSQGEDRKMGPRGAGAGSPLKTE